MGGRKSFPLRIDPVLYEALREWADQELRSVNGQIEFLLRQAVVARRKSLKDSTTLEPPPDEESSDRA